MLSYYKSPSETQYGCRGAIALKQSTISVNKHFSNVFLDLLINYYSNVFVNFKPHELDDCRFDIRVNDCVWYLRAKTVEERQMWLNILEEQRVLNHLIKTKK